MPLYSSHSAGSGISSKSSHTVSSSWSIAAITEVDLMLGSFTDLRSPIISLSISSLAGMGIVGAAEPAAIIGGSRPIPQLASLLSMTPSATVLPARPPIGRRRHGTPGELMVMFAVPARAFWALITVFMFSRDLGKARHCSIARVGSRGITQNLMHRPL